MKRMMKKQAMMFSQLRLLVELIGAPSCRAVGVIVIEIVVFRVIFLLFRIFSLLVGLDGFADLIVGNPAIHPFVDINRIEALFVKLDDVADDFLVQWFVRHAPDYT